VSLESRLTDSLRTLLRREDVSDDVEISLVLCDDPFIQELNARYRGLDKPTDVLSFGQEPLPGFADPPRSGEGGTAHEAGGTPVAHEAGNISCKSDASVAHSPLLPFREEPCEAMEEGLPYALGDIVIALPTAARQAERAGWPLENEVVLLAVHGGLHLLGYDDETAEGAARMQQRTAEILTELGIPPPVEGSHPFFIEYP
jgi:probable rRNA maturation factor